MISQTDKGGQTLNNSQGYLPGYMLISSYSTVEKLTYVIMIIVGEIVLIVSCLDKWIREDKLRKKLDAVEGEEQFVFSKDIFNAWDNAIQSKYVATELNGTLCQLYMQTILEKKMKGQLKKRSRAEVLILVGKRLLGWILYCGIQFAAFTLIVYLTINQLSFRANIANWNSALQPLSGFIIPFVVSFINTLTPNLLKVITAYEKWDSGDMELDVLLFRMYLSSTLNLMVLAFTYLLLANPFLIASNSQYTFRVQLELQYNAKFTCRMDQAADGLFNLVLADFFLKMIEFWGAGITPYLLKMFRTKEGDNVVVKKEFSIADNMVAMFYTAGLHLLLFPFAPLSIVFMPLMLASKIKFEKEIMIPLYAKPKKPWKAQKAGAVFTLFYMCTIIVISLPAAGFFLLTESFPKECSIQDDHLGLCLTAISDSNICTISSDSVYYDYFSSSARCNGGYPSCLCSGSLACGPFINDLNALDVFRTAISEVVFLGFIWNVFFESSYGVWCVLIVLYVLYNMQWNAVQVSRDVSLERERSLLAQVQSLETEKLKQEKIVRRLKAIEAASNTRAVP